MQQRLKTNTEFQHLNNFTNMSTVKYSHNLYTYFEIIMKILTDLLYFIFESWLDEPATRNLVYRGFGKRFLVSKFVGFTVGLDTVELDR